MFLGKGVVGGRRWHRWIQRCWVLQVV